MHLPSLPILFLALPPLITGQDIPQKPLSPTPNTKDQAPDRKESIIPKIIINNKEIELNWDKDSATLSRVAGVGKEFPTKEDEMYAGTSYSRVFTLEAMKAYVKDFNEAKEAREAKMRKTSEDMSKEEAGTIHFDDNKEDKNENKWSARYSSRESTLEAIKAYVKEHKETKEAGEARIRETSGDMSREEKKEKELYDAYIYAADDTLITRLKEAKKPIEIKISRTIADESREEVNTILLDDGKDDGKETEKTPENCQANGKRIISLGEKEKMDEAKVKEFIEITMREILKKQPRLAQRIDLAHIEYEVYKSLLNGINRGGEYEKQDKTSESQTKSCVRWWNRFI